MKALVIALALAMPVPAAAEGVLDWGRCKLYPSKCRPAPAAPIQAPAVAPPPVLAPVAPAPQVTPAAPPVAAPAVVPPRAAPPRRGKTKAVKVKPVAKVKARPKWKAKPHRQRAAARAARVAMPSWWNCAETRERVAGKTRAELALMRSAAQLAGYKLTKEQQVEAKRCLGFS